VAILIIGKKKLSLFGRVFLITEQTNITAQGCIVDGHSLPEVTEKTV
jgi:hypothetical protein